MNKGTSTTRCQRKAQTLLALLIYRLAQGPVDIEYFASLLLQIYRNQINKFQIDSSVFTNSPFSIDLSKLVKKKRLQRKSDELRHAYQEYFKQINQSDNNTVSTVEDIVNGWADLTGQDKKEFMVKVTPQINALIIKTGTKSRVNKDSENEQTDADLKFIEDLFLMLIEATPPEKKDALVAKMKDAILNADTESYTEIPDQIFNFGSGLIISDLITTMDNAFSANPAAKELLQQPLSSALIEIEAKKCGWKSGVPADNNTKLLADLKSKGLFFNQRIHSRALKELARRNIFLNVYSALDGTLMKDLEKTILEQRTSQTNTQSIWVSEPVSIEAEAEAEKKVLELLFKRRKGNDKSDRNH